MVESVMVLQVQSLKSFRPKVRRTTDYYGGAYPPSKTSPSYVAADRQRPMVTTLRGVDTAYAPF